MVYMEKKIRMLTLVPEEIRSALRIEAAKKSSNMGDIIAELVIARLQESVEEARRHLRKCDE